MSRVTTRSRLCVRPRSTGANAHRWTITRYLVIVAPKKKCISLNIHTFIVFVYVHNR